MKPVCLQGNEPSTGLSVIVKQCQDVVPTDQKWSINSNGTITSLSNGYCLTVVDCQNSNGAEVRILPCEQPPNYSCQSGKNQLWNINDNGTITSVLDNACLDVYNFKGPVVDTWQCNGGHNQMWKFNSEHQCLHSEQQNMNICLAVQHTGRAWSSDGQNKEIFLALFNIEDVKANITVDLDDIKKESSLTHCLATNMWFPQETTIVEQIVSAELPPHGSTLYNLTNCHYNYYD
jgi:hypothetical protein